MSEISTISISGPLPVLPVGTAVRVGDQMFEVVGYSAHGLHVRKPSRRTRARWLRDRWAWRLEVNVLWRVEEWLEDGADWIRERFAGAAG